jgi:hypothetical protein
VIDMKYAFNFLATCLLLATAAPAFAHILRERNFDFTGDYLAPLDALEAILMQEPVPAPAASEPVVTAPSTGSSTGGLPTGPEIELLNTYNKAGVQNGNPTTPDFTLTVPTLITHIQTYHWNNQKGTTAPGRIGLSGSDMWQATGREGMFNTPNAEWVVTPNIILQPGYYAVVDDDPATWSINSGSGGFGFAIVRGIEVAASTPPPDDLLTERQALEKLGIVTPFTAWVKAVRAAGNRPIYEVVKNPSGVCDRYECDWCFRFSEDLTSHQSYFATYCVNAKSGNVEQEND